MRNWACLMPKPIPYRSLCLIQCGFWGILRRSFRDNPKPPQICLAAARCVWKIHSGPKINMRLIYYKNPFLPFARKVNLNAIKMRAKSWPPKMAHAAIATAVGDGEGGGGCAKKIAWHSAPLKFQGVILLTSNDDGTWVHVKISQWKMGLTQSEWESPWSGEIGAKIFHQSSARQIDFKPIQSSQSSLFFRELLKTKEKLNKKTRKLSANQIQGYKFYLLNHFHR